MEICTFSRMCLWRLPKGEKLEMDEDIARRTMARVDKVLHRIPPGLRRR